MKQTIKRKNGRSSTPANRLAEQRASNGNGAAEHSEAPSARLPVLKTYKIYIGGKFPRTESGRYYLLKDPQGKPSPTCASAAEKISATPSSRHAARSRAGQNAPPSTALRSSIASRR